MSIEEYAKATAERQNAIRKNAGLRFAGRAGDQVKPPAKPDHPYGWEILEPDGTYIGMSNHEDQQYAHDQAMEAGWKPGTYQLKKRLRYR